MVRMLGIHLHKLFHSVTFVVAFSFSLLLLLVPALMRILALQGSLDTALAPAWFYASQLEPPPVNPYRSIMEYYVLFGAPLMGAIVYGAFFYDDSREGIVPAFFTRISKYTYWCSGALAAFLSAFLVVFVPLLLSKLLFCVAVPLDTLKFSPGYPTEDIYYRNIHIFKQLAIQHPYVFYYLLYSVIPALFSALLAVLSFGLSLFVRKSRLLLVLLPGIGTQVVSFLVALFGSVHWSPASLLSPSHSITGVYPAQLIVLFAVLLAADALLLWVGFKRNRDIL